MKPPETRRIESACDPAGPLSGGAGASRHISRLTHLYAGIDRTLEFQPEGSIIAVNARFGTSYLASRAVIYPWIATLPDKQRQWLRAHRTEICANLAPDTEAIRAVNGAVEAGYAVTIATERDQALETVTLAWLTRWQIRRTAIAVTGTGGKDRLLAGHGHDRPAILIDDDPAKERLVRPGVQVWVPPRAWAHDGLAPENVWRFETWRHIAARLECDARTPR